MAHETHEEKLLHLLEASRETGELFLSDLRITAIPYFPEGLRTITCANMNIRSLPPLPPTLEELYVYMNPDLRHLPDLPDGLRILNCSHSALTELPQLPASLETLSCNNTLIQRLPSLPSGLLKLHLNNCNDMRTLPILPASIWYLTTYGTPLILTREGTETIQAYSRRWTAWREECDSRRRSQERCAAIKEPLIQELWKPARVEKALATGGWDRMDADFA
jgi:hypothetical protein